VNLLLVPATGSVESRVFVLIDPTSMERLERDTRIRFVLEQLEPPMRRLSRGSTFLTPEEPGERGEEDERAG
jgi:hypothetical protein